jgi:iron complex transport system substrate-binding protein
MRFTRIFTALVAAATLGANVGSATASPDDGKHPVTVAGDQGDVTIEQQPTRIVSLSPSLTEMLFAIGAGDQVVAVDRNSNHPKRVPTTDLSGFRPNVEAIVGYQPDLVVLASDRDGVADALAAAGVPALLLGSADRVRDTYREIRVLGAATGHEQQAKQLVRRIRRQLQEIADAAPDREKPVSYFYELSPELHSATSRTFIGDLFGRIGLESIADGADPAAGGFPQLSNEYVVDADPEIIFVAHTDGSAVDPAEVAARPGWSEIAAVKDDRIVALDPDLSTRWGPRIVALLRAADDATDGLRG